MQNSVDAKDTNTTIKIATFNLCNYLAPPDAFYDFENIYSQQQWDKKQAWIKTYLTEQQPDVIGFQEVFSAESLKALTQNAGYPYFGVVDSPNIEGDYIYDSPVVAIASRFPITDLQAVTEEPHLNTPLRLSNKFEFSRKPLRATIQLPQIGLCDCYVVHFKSKRSISDDSFSRQNTPDVSAYQKAVEVLRSEMLGQWASTQQRSAEAAHLINAIWSRKTESGYPVMLMGDFNDELETSVLHHLLSDSARQIKDDLSRSISQRYRLQHSWQLFQSSLCHRENIDVEQNGSVDNIADLPPPVTTKRPAPYTFYYGAKGMVLDYILLSGEFDPGFSESMAEVYDYHLYDRHLINSSYDIDSHSTDHAIVMITLRIRQ
ncbi:endonuclease/exonuclease/phosphatase family protein [Photobacterium sp. DNB23_23_1]|uniref:Endonuclease/exonuclease/phosphatase family protein n=1 Tax=Photobacterium pectinilyticum TaxID=2906793 RepID=A0ABT1N6J1_9GAMM|nr:endonuclease/exonuclease/phosphatase family protein [Photobacterium sp. ZSDE20]MCQ1058854.1 endonuclease/exonuclease/phosphatase family protein [Photobacterium sp. ZSDE20]MDD1823856.1 endonuclease/exonuclease/phosphatase family protein [Photobacterium sp. ZSDE20]